MGYNGSYWIIPQLQWLMQWLIDAMVDWCNDWGAPSVSPEYFDQKEVRHYCCTPIVARLGGTRTTIPREGPYNTIPI